MHLISIQKSFIADPRVAAFAPRTGMHDAGTLGGAWDWETHHGKRWYEAPAARG